MRKRPVYDYTQLGGQVTWIQHRGAGALICGEDRVQDELRSLRESLETLGLPVTRRIFTVSWIAAIVRELEAIEDDPGGDPATLTEEQARRLDLAMEAVETTLIAEASGVYAYVVTEKRIPTDTLLDDIAKLFDSGVYQSLPALAQRDLANAGKAIAFEMPTAAVFHLMRALEAVLQDLYCHFIRQNRLKEPRMWKNMIDQMRAKKTNSPPAPLLDHFDHIRENFRNPTNHPDAEYDMNEAQNLLSVAVDAVDRAAAAMKA
jgi:hypothetical protein